MFVIFAKMRFFLNYIIIQALKDCNILRSVKVYFFWKISTRVEVQQKSHCERPFDYAQGDKMRTSL